eukprot:784694-Pleurochrysis_carterae.AAC.1
MPSNAACRNQYTCALRRDQIACPTLPATNATQACDSTSDAASAKADDGSGRGRCRNAKSMVKICPARWWLNSLGPRWPPTSKISTARVRNV